MAVLSDLTDMLVMLAALLAFACLAPCALPVVLLAFVVALMC